MKYILILVLVALSSGCLSSQNTTDTSTNIDWRTFELNDVKTGDSYSIADFEGKVVLLESFAVWCPTCLNQQKEMKKFVELHPDVILISLDTDPNESSKKVLEHIDRHELEWLFSVPPSEYTESLIDEFGFRFVSAPSAPVVLICEDGSARFLPSGVKNVEDLEREVELGCF